MSDNPAAGAGTKTPEMLQAVRWGDVSASEDTAWIPYQGDFAFQVRFVDGNLAKRITERTQRLTPQKRRSRFRDQTPSIDFNAMSRAYVELVILDWRGLYEDTVEGAPKDAPLIPIEYSSERAMMLLPRNIDLLTYVSNGAADPANFVAVGDKEDELKK